MAKTYKEHYDNTKLVHSLDRDGEVPTFFIVCSRLRGPGKTFQMCKMLFEKFLNEGKKFILLTRHKKDLGTIADGCFEGYFQAEHPEYTMREVLQMGHTFSRVFADTRVGEEVSSVECGYVIPLSAVNDVKKISSLFYDAWCFFFDEFMPVDDRFLKNEVDLLMNIYQSVARGEGKAVRYMPIYMCSNTLSIQNPYFKALGLTSKLQSNTHFFKGEGVVFENCDNVEGLAEMHKSSGIEKALKKHLAEKGDNTWINDDCSLVDRPKGWGRSRYIATLIYGSESFGVHEYYQMGYVYLSRTTDNTCPHIYNLTFDNGNLNIPVIHSSILIQFIKTNYFLGKVRCQDGGIQRILQEVM